MLIPLIVLFLVFLLIAIRSVGRWKFQIWQIMLGGAIIVLVTGQISIANAWHAINLDVLLFLFCMFIIGAALEESGYLAYLSFRAFNHAKSADVLVLSILGIMGAAAAVSMNDTIAIIGTPVVLMFAAKNRFRPSFLLLALAFAITIGSVVSPLGNPQNFLIAMKMDNPFTSFIWHLIIPTILSLLAAYAILRLFYRSEFHGREIIHAEPQIKDKKLAELAKVSLMLILFLIGTKIILSFLGIELPLTAIAPMACIPVLMNRASLIKKVDWRTIVFFAAMFVLMQSVWEAEVFQRFVNSHMTSIPSVLTVSILVSQLISNVPLVTLYLPVLIEAGVREQVLLALAAGSTIAGNMLILGAASNIIIIQTAEKSRQSISFWEFAKVGIPLTLVTAGIYGFFLMW
jgi:Na+/H+ antiporter NhaD/arsenite permease-like protein